MSHVVTTYAAQAGAAMRTAVADRATFALQVGGMVVNNGFWLVLWFLFFAGFQQVGGWRMGDLARLLGVLYVLVGAAGVFFGGYRDMAGAILRGELDALLTQPKPVLPRLLARESIPSAWGDLGTGAVILVFSAGLSLPTAALALAAILIGLTAWVSTAVIFASLAFWAAGARSLSRDLMDFTILVSGYPGSIYSGWTKLVAFTVLPAGFIAIAPVELVRNTSWQAAAIALGGAGTYAALALAVFHLGLARYRRGATPSG